jgi:zinc finger CCHC domain-containing protein 9
MTTTTTVTTSVPSDKDGIVATDSKTKPSKKMRIKGKPTMTKDERREKYTAIARQRQNNKKLKTIICYQCRQRGHSIQNCPNNKNRKRNEGGDDVDNDQEPTNDNDQQQKPSKKLLKKLKRQQQQRDKNFISTSSSSPICYKCGSTEHTLSNCPKRKNTIKRQHDDRDDDNVDDNNTTQNTNEILPFAKCFICQQNGHLAFSCPQNNHGVYVSGNGSCRICQSKQHRVSDCPEKNKLKKSNTDDDNANMYYDNSELLNDDNDIENNKSANSDGNKKNDTSNPNAGNTSTTPKKRKVVKF